MIPLLLGVGVAVALYVGRRKPSSAPATTPTAQFTNDTADTFTSGPSGTALNGLGNGPTYVPDAVGASAATQPAKMAPVSTSSPGAAWTAGGGTGYAGGF